MKIVIGCSGAYDLAKKVSAKAKLNYSPLNLKVFPDNEFKIRFLVDVKGKEIFLVQSFYGDISKKIMEVLFAAYTAKDLEAKKIILLATYFPYLRQDKRFKPRESVSADVIKHIFTKAPFDKILIVEPHLHRIKNLKSIFPNGQNIKISKDISSFIKARIHGRCFFMGPDKESMQWISPIAKKLNGNYSILRKKRFTAHKVKISPKIKKYNADNAVIIDDICSTGGTLLEAIRILKPKYKKIYCIIIHGLFLENVLKKLRSEADVFSTNSIPSSASSIDISNTLAEAIKNA